MIFIVDQKYFPKLINVWYGISTYWVEFCSKINKHPQTLIRYSRVVAKATRRLKMVEEEEQEDVRNKFLGSLEFLAIKKQNCVW